MKSRLSHFRILARRKRAGFALVVTLTLMILLTVIAVGLLSLSSISLRSTSQSGAMSMAKANARLALMQALGELQKNAGPDTRITARADVLDAENPPVTGVWKSWEGKDHDETGTYLGRPKAPVGGYQTAKQSRFLTWLASGDPAVKTIPDTAKAPNKVTLVGDHTVGGGIKREKLQVHLTPTRLNLTSQKGGFAWWVGGENQKARLPMPYQPSVETSGRWAVHSKSHAIADPKSFRMEDLLTDASAAKKGISLKQADLLSKAATLPTSQEFFHDLSANSTGLLTNVATGGWKKDLSLLTENWAAAGTSNLPLFRLKPGQDILCNIPTSGNASIAKSMLYPWASYRGGSGDLPIYQHGPVTSWENLKDFALAYKRMTFSTSGVASMVPFSVQIKGDTFNYLHRVRILPVIARIQWVHSHSAGPPSPPPAGVPPHPAGSLEPRLLLTPVITMWNPYNFELTSTPLNFFLSKPLPVALKYTVGSVTNANYNCLTKGSDNNKPALSTTGMLSYQIPDAFTLKAGETRVFSPGGATLKPVEASTVVQLKPGIRTQGGHYFALNDPADSTGVKKLGRPASDIIKVDAKFDTVYSDKSLGVGIFLDMNLPTDDFNNGRLVYRMVYTPTVAAAVYKPLTGLATSPSLSVIQTNASPFMTTIFGARMASRTHIAAKGLVQSSPLVNYTAMGDKDMTETTIGRHYGGTSHPVNSPFDYSFESVGGSGDTLLPQASDATNRGYIVTGFGKSDGLFRCVINELPTRPLQSLAELQHWDLRYDNPIPPFALNLIGNSDATPLLPANAVVNSVDANLTTNLQYDDSYCANHLLFDDWFFSSIAPDPTNFGTSGKNLKATYTSFITGTSPLPNNAYKALPQDANFAAVSTANVNTLYTNHVSKSDSWKSVASRLEVEGMFNVNSTSVAAWRALLGHARNQKIPYMNNVGNPALSASSDYAFSRFSVAGDVEAKSKGSSGDFPEDAEFSGYRILDEGILDALAAEIVKQVRQRGPFLSLSEFINRQLSSGDLALAGTIQAALNKISESSSTNPYSGIIEVIDRPSLAVPASSATQAEYKFPAAAVGQCTYGLPGWTRQADVLRALAPILTVRDDTFTIRGYGDARDKSGNILARATCEAVVRRTRDYVDSADLPEITTLPTRPMNIAFGRRFQMVSLRWLSSGEI
jgi:hypothetical protein